VTGDLLERLVADRDAFLALLDELDIHVPREEGPFPARVLLAVADHYAADVLFFALPEEECADLALLDGGTFAGPLDCEGDEQRAALARVFERLDGPWDGYFVTSLSIPRTDVARYRFTPSRIVRLTRAM
jgi:hypothetical protein